MYYTFCGSLLLGSHHLLLPLKNQIKAQRKLIMSQSLLLEREFIIRIDYLNALLFALLFRVAYIAFVTNLEFCLFACIVQCTIPNLGQQSYLH